MLIAFMSVHNDIHDFTLLILLNTMCIIHVVCIYVYISLSLLPLEWCSDHEIDLPPVFASSTDSLSSLPLQLDHHN